MKRVTILVEDSFPARWSGRSKRSGQRCSGYFVRIYEGYGRAAGCLEALIDVAHFDTAYCDNCAFFAAFASLFATVLSHPS